jgi:nucleotide-binding universal stress UspA family protein
MTYVAVPLDGSPLAETAIPVASAIAWNRGLPLKLITVQEPALRDMHAISAPALDPLLESNVRAKLLRYVESVGERLGTEPGLKVETLLLEGSAGAALAAEFAAEPPALVVLTTHARGGFNRLWMGSVATDLARRTTVPLLLLRPENDRAMWNNEFNRVLIPLDGSTRGERVIDAALELVGPGAAIALLRVIPAMRDLMALGAEELMLTDPDPLFLEQAEDFLAAIASRLEERGYIVENHVMMESSPARGIVTFAEEWEADFIAMSTNGRGALGRLILGSVTDKVLRASTVPVLLQHPEEVRRPEAVEKQEAAGAIA